MAESSAMWLAVTLFIFENLSVVLGARILAFFPLCSRSHHLVYQPIIQELSRRGHNVTYVTPFPIPRQSNLNIIHLNEQNCSTFSNNFSLVDYGKLSVTDGVIQFLEMSLSVAELMWNDPEIIKIINSNETYDLLFNEALFAQPTVSVLAHKFRVPSVTILTLSESSWATHISGLTDNPSYMMDYKTSFTDQMNFLERIYNMYLLMTILLLNYRNMQQMQVLADNYVHYSGWETRPSLLNLIADQALILVNTHHTVGYSYPKAPHVKEIGGITIKPSMALPQDIDEFLNGATHGAIYLSMGTFVNWTDPALGFAKEEFFEAFKRIKQKVLWRWSDDQYPKFPESPENIKFGSWFPQQDILSHRNTKLIITHGGLMSITEAIHNAVPILGIPVFGDQFKNMKHASSRGYGLELELKNIKEHVLRNMILEILQNQSYKQEAFRRSLMLRDRPMKPLDEAVYWIEYVLKYGKVLQPPSVHMPLYILCGLDVLLSVFVTSLVVIWTLYNVLLIIAKIFIKKRAIQPKMKIQ